MTQQRIFNQPETGTAEWHEWRRGGVGASEWTSVAPELDPNGWGCQRRLVYEKSRTPESDPQVDPANMRRGRFMEPLVAEILAERWGYRVYTVAEMVEAGHQDILRVRGGLPSWWLGSPDRFVYHQETHRWGVAELKCPNPYYFNHLRHDGLPPAWVVQPQHYLYTFPACEFGVVCMMEPVDLDAERIPFDVNPEVISQLRRRGEEFWTKILPAGPSAASCMDIGHEKCRTCPFQSRCYRERGLMDEAGGYVQPKGRPAADIATEQVEDAYLDWSNAVQTRKNAEEVEAAAKGRLVGLLGDGARVEVPNQLVTLETRRTATKRFSTERFKKANPKLYEEFRSLSIGEVSVKERKNEDGVI